MSANASNPWYNYALAVTTSDTVNIPQPSTKTLTDALWVGTGGDVVVVMDNGVAVTFGAVPNGAYLSVGAKRVNQTNTTASGIVALWIV